MNVDQNLDVVANVQHLKKSHKMLVYALRCILACMLIFISKILFQVTSSMYLKGSEQLLKANQAVKCEYEILIHQSTFIDTLSIIARICEMMHDLVFCVMHCQRK